MVCIGTKAAASKAAGRLEPGQSVRGRRLSHLVCPCCAVLYRDQPAEAGEVPERAGAGAPLQPRHARRQQHVQQQHRTPRGPRLALVAKQLWRMQARPHAKLQFCGAGRAGRYGGAIKGTLATAAAAAAAAVAAAIAAAAAAGVKQLEGSEGRMVTCHHVAAGVFRAREPTGPAFAACMRSSARGGQGINAGIAAGMPRP
jgi:hypothetical protein